MEETMNRARIGPGACTIATVGLIIWLISETSAAVKPREECAACHISGAKKDQVWTQFYRLLDR